MINTIKEFLEEADSNSANLFFIERPRNDATKEISYELVKTDIDSIIGRSLVEVAYEQISSELKCKSECVEYGISPYYDKEVTEFLRCTEVPYLSELIRETASTKLKKFSRDSTKNIFGYIIKVRNNNNNKTLYLFRKYSAKKLLETNKITMSIKGEGKFTHFDDKIVALDKTYDAAFISNDDEDLSDMNIFIFCRFYFELLFSFIEYYEKEIDNNKGIIEKKGILKDPNELISLCKKDSRMIKKFARILKNGDLSNMKIENITDIITQFNLKVNLEDDKLIVDRENIWTILRILMMITLSLKLPTQCMKPTLKLKNRLSVGHINNIQNDLIDAE